VSVVVLSGCRSVCAPDDAIGQAEAETLQVLRQYERSNDPASAVIWLFEDHREAPGHQVMLTTAEWCLDRDRQFLRLLDAMNDEQRALFVRRFSFALDDLPQLRQRFAEAYRGVLHPVVAEIMARSSRRPAPPVRHRLTGGAGMSKKVFASLASPLGLW